VTHEGVYASAYARALLGAAAAQRAVAAVTSDLRALEDQWNGSVEFRRFCHGRHQTIPGQRAQTVRDIWGDSLAPVTLGFLALLADWGQLHLLPLIVDRFVELADRAAGRHKADAAFACEPIPDELDRVRRMIADAYGPLVDLAVRVEPALLAGVRLRIDDRLVDASLAGRLARLKKGLLKPMPLEAAATGKP